MAYLLESLEELTLGYNQHVTDVGFSFLQNSKLKKLFLRWQENITERYLSCLPNTLKFLKLERYEYKIETLPANLSRLELHNITLDGAELSNLPNQLKKLTLSHCDGLSDECLQLLPSSLIELHIQDCKGFSSEAVRALKARQHSR